MFRQTPAWYRRSLIGLMLLAVAVRLFYFFYTHRTWEDALIAAQHSEDFVRGMGLSHPVLPGERPVEGFTSPLSVLVSLVGDWVRVGFGVTFLKLVSVVAGAATVLVGASITVELMLPYVAALGVGAFLALEYHQILWGMAGMETQLVTLSYLFVLWSCLAGTQRQKGIALGIAMLARPDAAFLVLIALAHELWQVAQTRKWVSLAPIVGWLVALYAPWLIFATIYYGSPVPNTVIAKSLGYVSVMHSLQPLSLLQKVSALAKRFDTVFRSLGPSYGGNGTGFKYRWDHSMIANIMLLLLFVGLIAAIKRRHRAALLLYAFVLTYGLYLTLAASVMFGWYTVPVAAGAVVCAFYGVWVLIQRRTTHAVQVLLVLGGCYAVCIAGNLPSAMRSDKYLQQNIESGVRMQMGLYMKTVSYPTDVIASESVGYLGYYSGRVIYDYPGLQSRRVIQYLHEYPQEQDHSLVEMMHHLQPTYLVLRPNEIEKNKVSLESWLDEDYDMVKVFKAAPDTPQRILWPDFNVDQEFRVYRHKGAAFRTPDVDTHRGTEVAAALPNPS